MIIRLSPKGAHLKCVTSGEVKIDYNVLYFNPYKPSILFASAEQDQTPQIAMSDQTPIFAYSKFNSKMK